MSRITPADIRSQVFMMLISAGIFAYFGFSMAWAHQYTRDEPPQLLIMVVALKWALRGGAIVFGAAAVLSMLGLLSGLLLYAIVGLVTAAVFLVVAVWDLTSPYYSGVAPILLLIFAAWNGYGSLMALKEILASPGRGGQWRESG